MQDFFERDTPDFLPADISALQGREFASHRKSTDWYMANLAEHHGMKWATLDQGADHPAAELIR